MISPKLKLLIEQNLLDFTGKPQEIISVEHICGGCINKAARIKTTYGTFFVKWNSIGRYPNMFEVEARGLMLLKEQLVIKIPVVIALGEADKDAYLLMEYVETGLKTPNFWNNFGASMARLHKVTGQYYGLDTDNYIGCLIQHNQPHANWTSFFIKERLEPQIKLALDTGAINSGIVKKFDALYKKLETFFPLEPPSLIHGDLWSGNFIATPDEQACIYDPAVYYGSREMDIAMSKLFGGFDKQFYESYNLHFHLQEDWEDRIDVYNLYPLLVHVNLFGGGYVSQVKGILDSLL